MFNLNGELLQIFFFRTRHPNCAAHIDTAARLHQAIVLRLAQNKATGPFRRPPAQAFALPFFATAAGAAAGLRPSPVDFASADRVAE